MQVRLVSYSQAADDFLILDDAQDLVAYCARVSNPSNQLNKETSEKLIKYLINNQHWSPLEVVSACLEITTTRDIARQILRHRSFSFQEFCIEGSSKISVVQPKGKIHYIPIKTLYERQHWKQYKDIQVRVFDEETKQFTQTKIIEVFYTGKKPCYKVTLSDNKSIICTKEHKFFTKKGFETLENLSSLKHHGTNLVTISPTCEMIAVNGVPLYQDIDWLLSAKQQAIESGVGLQYIATASGAGLSTITKWLRRHKIQFTKKEVASYTQVWNKDRTGYKTKPRTEEQREHMRKITPRGENHPAWRGGQTQRKQIANFFNTHRDVIFKRQNYKCNYCNVQLSGSVDLHHIKEVSLFPKLAYDINNVVALHEKCHYTVHKKFFKELQHKVHIGRRKTVKYVSIKSIEFVGECDTYDMQVDHNSHNYVANKIVVHNSQRYADPTKDLNFVLREARLQDKKNRQNSLDLDMSNDEERYIAYQWENLQKRIVEEAQRAYTWAIDKGIAKEQARAVLPEGLIESRLYMNGTLRSWIHFIQLRSANGTQKEHQEVAKACAEVISKIFPMAKDLT